MLPAAALTTTTNRNTKQIMGKEATKKTPRRSKPVATLNKKKPSPDSVTTTTLVDASDADSSTPSSRDFNFYDLAEKDPGALATSNDGGGTANIV